MNEELYKSLKSTSRIGRHSTQTILVYLRKRERISEISCIKSKRNIRD